MTKSLVPLLAVILTVAAAATVAQTPPSPPPEAAKSQAAPYVSAAGSSDLYEINSSRIAIAKSQNPAVRRYAAMLIKHHQKTTVATLAAARKAGLTPTPPTLDPGAAGSINELQQALVTDFDRLYLAQQVPAHQAAIDLHQRYGAGGDQTALRTSAKAAVPIVKQHLATAEKMQRVGQSDHSGN